MKHVIIGTAGHVDHGKTLLVKALTGIDTDRLKEEKKRGITIELGFAHITFDNGLKAGVIDVPGHEKFIKNMLAGAGGIDFAMLIVAADEGIMPQTEEHLDILNMLNITHGIIVITKSDLVDEAWLTLLKEEISERVQGTFLENAEMIAVSAYTGEGLQALKEKLGILVLEAESRNIYAPFRMPIDRVFSVDGFGTVVTGTLIDGQIHVGDNVTLYPQLMETKVRNLQVHSEDVETAFAGQRVAVNLAGIKKTDVERGMVVSKPNVMVPSQLLDVKLQIFKDADRVVKNGSMVHVYHGTQAVLAKIVLLACDSLNPGEQAFAQLRLTEPLAARESDRFIIRFYSPLETIGGGTILNPNPQKHKRYVQAVIDALALREKGSDAERVLQSIQMGEATYKTLTMIKAELPLPTEVIDEHINTLLDKGELCRYAEDRYYSRKSLDVLALKAEQMLTSYHQMHPLMAGMPKEEFRKRLFGKLEAKLCDGLMAILEVNQGFVIDRNSVKRPSFKIEFEGRYAPIRAHFQKGLAEGGITPPTIEVLFSPFPKDKEACRHVLEAMVSLNEIVLVSPQIAFERSVYEAAERQMKAHFENASRLTLAEFRDMVGTSRKYAQALMEYWDRIKITRMVEDYRELIPTRDGTHQS